MVLEDLQQPPNGIKKWRSREAFEDSHSLTMLPTELILEVLLRLPVQSLLRFESVSKRWFSLISDPSFVKSHLSLSTTNNHYAHDTLITFSSHERIKISQISHLFDRLCDNSINTSELNYPVEYSPNFEFVVGSCNGLACMYLGKRLVIWNPSTNKSETLPFNMHSYFGYGFGYEESTADYKVVEISNTMGNCGTSVDVYSLKTEQWKKISAFPDGISPLHRSGIFVRGVLHWLASNRLGSPNSRSIISLDLAKETFGEVVQPLYDEGDKYLTLGALGEWLCVCSSNDGIRMDFWVIKGYGVKDSWTKLVSISRGAYCERPSLLLTPWIIHDGKIVLHFGLKFIVYDLKNSSYSEIQNRDGHVTVCRYLC